MCRDSFEKELTRLGGREWQWEWGRVVKDAQDLSTGCSAEDVLRSGSTKRIFCVCQKRV